MRHIKGTIIYDIDGVESHIPDQEFSIDIEARGYTLGHGDLDFMEVLVIRFHYQDAEMLRITHFLYAFWEPEFTKVDPEVSLTFPVNEGDREGLAKCRFRVGDLQEFIDAYVEGKA